MGLLCCTPLFHVLTRHTNVHPYLRSLVFVPPASETLFQGPSATGNSTRNVLPVLDLYVTFDRLVGVPTPGQRPFGDKVITCLVQVPLTFLQLVCTPETFVSGGKRVLYQRVGTFSQGNFLLNGGVSGV